MTNQILINCPRCSGQLFVETKTLNIYKCKSCKREFTFKELNQ